MVGQYGMVGVAVAIAMLCGDSKGAECFPLWGVSVETIGDGIGRVVDPEESGMGLERISFTRQFLPWETISINATVRVHGDENCRIVAVDARDWFDGCVVEVEEYIPSKGKSRRKVRTIAVDGALSRRGESCGDREGVTLVRGSGYSIAVRFDGRDEEGMVLRPGLYDVKLVCDIAGKTKKLGGVFGAPYGDPFWDKPQPSGTFIYALRAETPEARVREYWHRSYSCGDDLRCKQGILEKAFSEHGRNRDFAVKLLEIYSETKQSEKHLEIQKICKERAMDCRVIPRM